ncbi:putative transposase [Trichonephila clavipes]|nr:putative transposase [Trichonephila clavipes]
MSNGVLSSFASDLNTTQRKLLQNFSKPTETVFGQGPRFFGGLRPFQKEESQLKINLAVEGPQFQKPLKMSLESGILCVQIPPYSLDLSPRDFFLFPELKNHLKGHHFGTLENIQTAVTDQLKAIPISELHQCYEKWKKRLQRCVALEGSYFEGDNVEFRIGSCEVASRLVSPRCWFDSTDFLDGSYDYVTCERFNEYQFGWVAIAKWPSQWS